MEFICCVQDVCNKMLVVNGYFNNSEDTEVFFFIVLYQWLEKKTVFFNNPTKCVHLRRKEIEQNKSVLFYNVILI